MRKNMNLNPKEKAMMNGGVCKIYRILIPRPRLELV